jgi:hypothetical protein
MAMVNARCGGTFLRYDSARCAFACTCPIKVTCTWSVTCPDGAGGYLTTSGTGREVEPHKIPALTLAGNLEACAYSLSKLWKRTVTVPEGLRGKKIRQRTLHGTPGEIAEALGLKLGSNRQS